MAKIANLFEERNFLAISPLSRYKLTIMIDNDMRKIGLLKLINKELCKLLQSVGSLLASSGYKVTKPIKPQDIKYDITVKILFLFSNFKNP